MRESPDRPSRNAPSTVTVIDGAVTVFVVPSPKIAVDPGPWGIRGSNPTLPLQLPSPLKFQGRFPSERRAGFFTAPKFRGYNGHSAIPTAMHIQPKRSAMIAALFIDDVASERKQG